MKKKISKADYEPLLKRLESLIDSEPLNLRRLTNEEEENLESLHQRNKPHMVKKMTVDFIRHKCTRYDEICARINQKKLVVQDYDPDLIYHEFSFELVRGLKKRVLKEIKSMYPRLATECDRQSSSDFLNLQPNDFKFSFGPFKGSLIRDMPESYLFAVLEQPNQDRKIKHVVKAHLLTRLKGFGACAA